MGRYKVNRIIIMVVVVVKQVIGKSRETEGL